jgi:hypothetical protein
VRDVLKKEKEANGSIGRIEVYRASDHPDPVRGLARMLLETTWHLVHFADTL